MSLAAAERDLGGTITRVLSKTPPHLWGAYALLVDGEEGGATLLSRGSLAPWLRSHDLGDLADEAAARAARPATGLLLLILGGDGPRFKVFGGDVRRPGFPRGRVTPRRSPPRCASARAREGSR